jgi:hypothetical protein
MVAAEAGVIEELELRSVALSIKAYVTKTPFSYNTAVTGVFALVMECEHGRLPRQTCQSNA